MRLVHGLNQARKRYMAVQRGERLYEEDTSIGLDMASVVAPQPLTKEAVEAEYVIQINMFKRYLSQQLDELDHYVNQKPFSFGGITPARMVPGFVRGMINDFFRHINEEMIDHIIEIGLAEPTFLKQASYALAISKHFKSGSALIRDDDPMGFIPKRKVLTGYDMTGKRQGCFVQHLSTTDAREDFNLMISFIATSKGIAKKPYQIYAARLYLGKIRPAGGANYLHKAAALFGGFSITEKREAVQAALTFLETGRTIDACHLKVLNQGRTKGLGI